MRTLGSCAASLTRKWEKSILQGVVKETPPLGRRPTCRFSDGTCGGRGKKSDGISLVILRWAGHSSRLFPGWRIVVFIDATRFQANPQLVRLV